MNRRRFLGFVGALGASLSGCLGARGPSSAPTESATGTGTPTEPCHGDVERITHSGPVREGPLDGFDLTASKDTVPLGGEVTVRLENVATAERSTAEASTGNETKYVIERETAEGWRSIFWHRERETAVWNDEGIRHEPGEGFTWNLTLTRKALEVRFYHVCEPLEPGSYRFVYWGLSDENALGARFEVTEN